MKRIISWPALPLVLGALIFAVKWRVEHPTATKEDLEVRALLAQSGGFEVSHVIWAGKRLNEFKRKLSKSEFQPFINCFYLSPRTYGPSSMAMGKQGIITIARDDRVATIVASINLDKRVGELLITRSARTKMRSIHGITTKRWMELLMANPRIGPELRARMSH